MRVYVNGESKELSGPVSLAELVTQLELPAARIAVELNRVVVRRSDWNATTLQDEDRLEIVHFVGGGSLDLCVSVSCMLRHASVGSVFISCGRSYVHACDLPRMQ